MSRFEILEAVILSGQMPDRDLHELLASDPESSTWIKQRAKERHPHG